MPENGVDRIRYHCRYIFLSSLSFTYKSHWCRVLFDHCCIRGALWGLHLSVECACQCPRPGDSLVPCWDGTVGNASQCSQLPGPGFEHCPKDPAADPRHRSSPSLVLVLGKDLISDSWVYCSVYRNFSLNTCQSLVTPVPVPVPVNSYRAQTSSRFKLQDF
jgi:hypothetical protein